MTCEVGIMDKQKMTAFVGGEIVTVDAGNNMTTYEAMLVQGDTIAYLGDRSGLESFAADGYGDIEFVDLQGRSILPGFTDSHLHASSMTELVFDADILIGQPGTMFPREEALAKYRAVLCECVSKCPDNPVYRGAGWDPGIFMGTPEGFPTADDLDGIADDKPILLRSYDHHLLWINNKALELSGITAETPDPRNGTIYRDAEGNPTGVFQENTAVDLAMSRIPGAEYSVEEYKAGIKAFQSEFGNALGHTMVFDAYNSENGMKAYSELAEAGELTLRVKTCFYANPSEPMSQFDEIIAAKNKYHVGDLFNVDTVKFFVDGTGLSFCMHEPFEADWLAMAGAPEGWRGFPQWDQQELNEIFTMLHDEGFQIHVHCMGDRATTMTLDAFEYAENHSKTGRSIRQMRHTIAHLMQVKEADIERIGKLGVVAAMQPMWAQYASLADTMSSVSMGMDRVLDQYRIGAYIKAGSVVSFGTDFPVTIPPSPVSGLHVAVNRSVMRSQPDYEQFKDRKLGPIDNPSRDCCTLAEAIGAYCYGGAYQCFMENVTGSLAKGKSADFVILSETLSSLGENDIEKLQVEATYFRGEKVWNK